MKTMNRVLIVALAASIPLLADAYDCSAITTTANKAYTDNRNTGRAEVAKAPESGGAFSPPVQTKDSGCATDVMNAYYAAMAGFDSFTGVYPAYVNAALKAEAMKEAKQACQKVQDRANQERSRLGSYL